MTTSEFREALGARAAAARLVIRPNTTVALERYFELLRRWNRRINLTALDVDQYSDESLDRLVVEPLLAARHLGHELTHWIDLGSGGGSPAIPMRLLIARGTLEMVESRGRKVAFLREAVRTLDLERTGVIQSRFEALVDIRRADLITLRAVKVDSAIAEAIENLLAPGGRVALFGSAEPVDRLPGLRLERSTGLLPSSWLGIYGRE